MGYRFEAKTIELSHPYLLIKNVEYLVVASTLFPDSPISNNPEKMNAVKEALARMESAKSESDKNWEMMIKNWKGR
jgi:hypothetical protein